MKIKLAALAMMAVASSWFGGEHSHASQSTNSPRFTNRDKPVRPSMPAINNAFTRSDTKRKAKRGKAK